MDTLPSVLKSLGQDIKALGIELPVKHSDPWADPRSSAAASLLTSAFKKFKDLGDTTVQNAKALAKFEECNNACLKWDLQLNTTLDEELYGDVKDILWDFFQRGGEPIADSLDDCFMHGSLGEGASIGSHHESLYAKLFSSSLAAPNPGLIYHYENYIWQFPEWKNAELSRSASFGSPVCRPSSRLSFVAKNDSISRSTCTETPLGMFYQLGLGDVIKRRLSEFFGISLERQPDVNRELARVGSIDGSWATIDLESASDTIGLKMCRGLLPPHVMGLIELMRSRSTSYRGRVIPLGMVSTMGNGFTFPLQTAIFAAVVRAVMRSYGDKSRRAHVFGDDIIVPTRMFHRVCRLLGLLGFRVNHDKSFHEGPFRESCGVDYFNGVNVRGVYIKTLRGDTAVHVAINRLNEFSVIHGIPLPRTIKTLLGLLTRRFEVPMAADAASGIRTMVTVCESRPKFHKPLWAYTYLCWEWVPRRFHWKRSVLPVPKGRLCYNASGLLLAVLKGEVVPSYVTSRDVGRWRTKRRYSSNWDYVDLSSPLAGVDAGRIRSGLEVNLN